MARLHPFNVLTFLNDQELQKRFDLASAGLAAIETSLDRARSEGNEAHFNRLLVQFREYRDVVLALKADAVVPRTVPEFAVPAELRPAA